MERQRRDAQENTLWGNPCDYADGASKSTKHTVQFSLDDVARIANQAKSALSQAEQKKDTVALVLHDAQTFEAVLPQYEQTPWLHSFESFMADEVLPKNKTKLKQAVSPEFLSNVVSNIDSYLPSMQKALKMLVAGLNAVREHGLNTNLEGDLALQKDIEVIMNRVRQVLCVFNDVVETRPNVKPLPPLLESEVPDVGATDRLATVFLIYRDTMLYLDYLVQVMEAWSSQG